MTTSPASPKNWSISTASFGRRASRPQATGLALPAFNDDFDLFFEVKSDFLQQALTGGKCPDIDAGTRCEPIPGLRDNPAYWGLKVETIWKFWQYVQADAEGYAQAHQVDDDRCHVCLSRPCMWSHHDLAKVVSPENASGELKELQVTMHLLVRRYIKPWTMSFDKGCFALVMNAARLCDRSGPSAEELCLAKIFISHCWSEASTAFMNSLFKNFTPERVVWVCSMALWQHADISETLGDVATCPFVKAMKSCVSVSALTDESCEVFDRAWCVLEAFTALTLQKPYDITLDEDEDHAIWNKVASKLDTVDVRTCQAARASDKKMILAYAERQVGGVDKVNARIRAEALEASRQAAIRDSAREGDLEDLLKQHPLDYLRKWATTKRQRTITHLLAENGHLKPTLELLQMTNSEHLNLLDIDGRSPLSLACDKGDVAIVNALLTIEADPDSLCVHGLSPLHYASGMGYRTVVHLLYESKANLHLRGTFQGEREHTPMSIAVHGGYGDIARDFLSWKCDCNDQVEGLPLLHMAAKLGWPDVTAALIAAGVAVNGLGSGSHARTALMLASLCGHVAVVGLLLCAKADVHVKDADGETVLSYCTECEKDNPRQALEIRFFLVNFSAKRIPTRGTLTSLGAIAAISATDDITILRRDSALDVPIALVCAQAKVEEPTQNLSKSSTPMGTQSTVISMFEEDTLHNQSACRAKVLRPQGQASATEANTQSMCWEGSRTPSAPAANVLRLTSTMERPGWAAYCEGPGLQVLPRARLSSANPASAGYPDAQHPTPSSRWSSMPARSPTPSSRWSSMPARSHLSFGASFSLSGTQKRPLATPVASQRHFQIPGVQSMPLGAPLATTSQTSSMYASRHPVPASPIGSRFRTIANGGASGD